jgi:hypothetical protein
MQMRDDKFSCEFTFKFFFFHFTFETCYNYFMKKKIISIWQKYENHISSGMLLAGFLLDNFTLRSLDIWWDKAILISYLLIVGMCIVCVNLYDSGKIKTKFLEKTRPWFMFAMQFVLGGCFSASFVFYSRSATFSSSWPFLLVILAYLLGNEFFKKHYIRFSVQLGVYFMAIFSLCILLVPVLLKKMGDWVFILSGIVSLILISVFIYILHFVTMDEIKKSKKTLIYIIGGIFITINILYFTNMIPPAPLSLKEIGLYTSVKKNVDGTYALSGGQKKTFSSFFNPTETFYLNQGESAYLFSSIFSPAKLNTKVVHVWYNYNEKTKNWEDVGQVKLAIYGGRGDGYRTYSIRDALEPGLWRVDIETESGQLIGRKKFEISS